MNPLLTDEQRLGEPEFSLYIECVWRLDDRECVICGAWDDNAPGGTLILGLQGLVSQTLLAVKLSEPSCDVDLSFANDWTLRIFCDQVNEHDSSDNYSLFSQEQVLIVGTKSRLRIEHRKADRDL